MRYDVLLFDADETLFDFKTSERVALKNTLFEYGLDSEDKQLLTLYSEINAEIWKAFERGEITQKALKVERFHRFIKQANLSIDADQMAKRFIYHLGEASYLFDETKPLIDALGTSFEMVIVTNGLTDVQNRRIGKSSISHCFKAIVISESIGIAKPDPAIFEHTLETIGFKDKSRVLMIGDSLGSDILGGQRFGIDTCWYNPHRKINDTQINPTYEIHDLMALLEIVK